MTRLVPLLATASAMVTPSVPNASPLTGKLTSAEVQNNGKQLAVGFADGFKCRFHSLWLRDACRDAQHVALHAGERYLTATPVGPSGERPDLLAASSASIDAEANELRIDWSESSFGPHQLSTDPPRSSAFPAAFLRAYSEIVAEPIVSAPTDAPAAVLHEDLAWLSPYSAFQNSPAPSADSMVVWRNDGTVDLPVYDHDDVLNPRSSANLRMLQDMAKYGAVIIDGCSEPGESVRETRASMPHTPTAFLDPPC